MVIQKVVQAFLHSYDGLKAALKEEFAFKLEVIIAIPMTIFAATQPFPLISKALMISSLLLVLMAELFNSALEAALDRISTKRHPLIKKAKDMGSAAVLMSLLYTGIIWAFLLYDFYVDTSEGFLPENLL